MPLTHCHYISMVGLGYVFVWETQITSPSSVNLGGARLRSTRNALKSPTKTRKCRNVALINSINPEQISMTILSRRSSFTLILASKGGGIFQFQYFPVGKYLDLNRGGKSVGTNILTNQIAKYLLLLGIIIIIKYQPAHFTPTSPGFQGFSFLFEFKPQKTPFHSYYFTGLRLG